MNFVGQSYNIAFTKKIDASEQLSLEQVDIHAPWGGVVPALASEAHRNAMDGTVQEVLLQAGVQESSLDAVAVTIGPGLSMCLKVYIASGYEILPEPK